MYSDGAAADFPEYVNLVAADPEHPLHKEALEFTRMNNDTLFSTPANAVTGVTDGVWSFLTNQLATAGFIPS